MNGRFRAHDIVGLVEFASIEFHMTFTKSSIARAFEVDHSAVRRAVQRCSENPPAGGRHCELSIEK
jgi:DNA-binding transcriptional regulator LsrR (DeoR family)